MQQENAAQLNDYYKSLEAGKIKPKESLPTTMIVSEPSWPGSGGGSSGGNSNNINNSSDLTFIQFEICKKLCEHYEKLDDNYIKFTRILNAESKFAQLATKFAATTSTDGGTVIPSIESMAAAAAAVAARSPSITTTNNNNNNIQQQQQQPSSLPPPSHQQQHHGHLYFRIGLFGRSLKFECIQNQYFLYRHKSYDMLSNIQSLIINKIAYGGKCGGGGENNGLEDTSLPKVGFYDK